MQLIILLLLASSLFGADYYASASASAGGAGTLSDPWRMQDVCPSSGSPVSSLTTALAAADVTVWLRGGTYTGNYICTASSAHTLTIRSYPKERAKFDGVGVSGSPGYMILFQTGSQNITLMDVEMFNSSPVRSTLGTAAFPDGFPEAIEVYGANINLVNLLIHDVAQGIGWWSNATGGEVRGCIFYNIGWRSSTTTGHELYTQNNTSSSTKLVTRNIFGTTYGFGLHAYTQSFDKVSHYALSHNVYINPSNLAGGTKPAKDISFDHEYMWYPVGFGYNTNANNVDLTISNTLMPPNPNNQGADFSGWQSITATSNLWWSGVWGPNILDGTLAPTTLTFTGNSYYAANSSTNMSLVIANGGAQTYRTWTQWQSFGQDTDGALVTTARPLTAYYEPNTDEANRCHVIVMNPGSTRTATTGAASTASLDLSQCGLSSGDAYELWEVQDLGAANPLAKGVYAGSAISVDLTETGYTLPAGDPSIPARFAKTSTLFRVYLVRSYQSATRVLKVALRNDVAGATQVKVLTGGTTALEYPAQTVSCSYGSRCLVSIPTHFPGTSGQYYAWQWLDGSGNVKAQSAIIPLKTT